MSHKMPKQTESLFTFLQAIVSKELKNFLVSVSHVHFSLVFT